MKAQDVLVALKLITIGEEPWSFARLGKALGLSVGASHNAITHLHAAGLVFARRGEAVVARRRFLDFLVHGVPASFYPVRGPLCRGTPTAFSAPSLSSVSTGVDRAVAIVWPVANGRVTGESLEPLYPTAPRAALMDPELYELLALIDCLRVGKARERKTAAELLEKKIMEKADKADEDSGLVEAVRA